MQLKNPDADVYVPDDSTLAEALARTTHLAIGAHQDDIEFMALHGILQCFNQDDRWFSGITITDGGGSSRSGPIREVLGRGDAEGACHRAAEGGSRR